MGTHERWNVIGRMPRRKPQQVVPENPWADMSKFQPSPIVWKPKVGDPVGCCPPPHGYRSQKDKYDLMLDNVVTGENGKLERVTRYSKTTAGREGAKAESRYTRTSLDKDFVVDESAEMNNDGDDHGSFEPTQSLTMTPEPETQIETVVLHEGSSAHSYVETDAEHHRPEDLQILPPDFKARELGIKDRVGAFVLSEVLKAMQDFDLTEPESLNGTRDVRFAEFIQQRFKTQPFVAPQAEGMEEYALPEHREDEVLARLRKITAKQVRTMRERLSALGIYRSANPVS
jgi:hypothetical protein